VNSPTHSSPDLTALDAITGGALTAATSGERLTRVREWLNTEPALDVLQTVFKELSARDKGAAKPVKEKIDELRRAKTQDTLAEEWAEKARALLATSRLNVADAMAWARDTAKAGAPLSREPLAGLRLALADRVSASEDAGLESYFPKKFPARVRIRYTGGKVVESRILDPLGSTERPLTRAGIADKFRTLNATRTPRRLQDNLIAAASDVDAPGGLERLCALLGAGNVQS